MKRTTLLCGTVAVGLALLTACGGSGESANPDDPTEIRMITLAATEPYVIPWLVGQEEGFFESRGVKITEILSGKGGSSTLRTQLSGDVPIGEVGYRSVMEAVDAGTPISAVGGGTQSPFGLDFYAMADNSRVNELADVRRWAYTNPQSTIEALSVLIPDKQGTERDGDERIAAGGIGEGVALLESGEVDAAVVPPSLVGANAEKFKMVVRSSDYFPQYQQSVITTTKEYAQENPDIVEAVLAGYAEAVQWIHDNPREASQLYADHIDLNVDDASSLVQGAIDVDIWNVGYNAESLSNASAGIEVSGFEGELDYCSAFDPSFLPEGTEASLPTECEK